MTDWILYAIAVSVLLLLAWMMHRQQQRLLQLQKQSDLQQELLSQLMEQLKLGKKATTSLLDRVKMVEQKTRVGEMQLDQIAQKHSDEKNYSEAIKRVKNGADVDELVEHCHLLPNEAQLLIMMHGNK